MFASIFTAPKRSGFKWQLLIHSAPSLHSDSVEQTLYFDSKVTAKATAKKLGCKAYNY
jgi:hypothetical protein